MEPDETLSTKATRKAVVLGHDVGGQVQDQACTEQQEATYSRSEEFFQKTFWFLLHKKTRSRKPSRS